MAIDPYLSGYEEYEEYYTIRDPYTGRVIQEADTEAFIEQAEAQRAQDIAEAEQTARAVEEILREIGGGATVEEPYVHETMTPNETWVNRIPPAVAPSPVAPLPVTPIVPISPLPLEVVTIPPSDVTFAPPGELSGLITEGMAVFQDWLLGYMKPNQAQVTANLAGYAIRNMFGF